MEQMTGTIYDQKSSFSFTGDSKAHCRFLSNKSQMVVEGFTFDTIAKTLTLNGTVPGFGLHQYVTSNAARDRVYATTMSEPPRIFSWAVDKNFQFTHLDTVNVSK